MITELSCKRTHYKWTMLLFIFLLDVAAYNAFDLYKHRYGDIKRRHSLEKLVVDLLKPYIESRVQKVIENEYESDNDAPTPKKM